MKDPIDSELRARTALIEMLVGKWVSQAISTAAAMGIADHLDRDGGSKTVDQLALATGSHPGALYRLLRALASVGIFVETEGKRFQHTPLSEPLREGAAGSVKGVAVWLGARATWNAWGELAHSVKTGEGAFEHLHGESGFDYFGKRPDEAVILNAAMTSISQQEAPAIATSYDFGSIRTLVDIGGGHGFLLGTILADNPGLEGVLFDLPSVVAGAGPVLDRLGVVNRCRVVGGNFFESVPPGDAYLLKHILHDWNDESCIDILRSCRKAVLPGGKVLVLGNVVTEGNEPDFGKLLDLDMLIMTTGGRERTEAEFRSLYRAAGFELTKIIRTPSPTSIVVGECL